MNNNVLKLVLCFYIFYFIMCFIGNVIIDYNDISLYTMLTIVIFIGSLSIGIIISKSSNILDISNYKKSFKRILYIMILINTISIFYSWFITINYYGSIEYIFLHAMTIRNENIGQSKGILPVYISYINAITTATFSIALSNLGYDNRVKNKILVSYIFILAALGDLLSFGRIGMLYCIFMIVGFVYVCNKRILSKKNILIAAALLFTFSLPRLIRGSFDNFSSTVDTYARYMNMDLNPILNPFISIYIYYFSSPYALDYFISANTYFSYGERTFAPIVNAIYRLFDIDDHIGLIDEFAAVPFQYNIYTVIRDFYGDFGPFGVFIISLAVGIYIGRIFSVNGFYHNALKFFMIGWILYTPIYNPLIFGGFFISFILLNIFALCERYGRHVRKKD